MKKYLLILLLAIGGMTAGAKDIKELVVTTMPQMSCQNCENRIKGNLRFEKGVKNVETDIENQRVTITYDADKTDEKKLEEAFAKINYKVTIINECDSSSNCTGARTVCPEKNDSCCASTKSVVIGYSNNSGCCKKK